MSYELKNLTPVMYTGLHQGVTYDDDLGAPARLTALDFPNEVELFRIQCAAFESLSQALTANRQNVSTAPGTIDQYSYYKIPEVVYDINEKLTQWSAITVPLFGAVDKIERELSLLKNKSTIKVTFSAEVRRLESNIEHFIAKALSILDLCALLGNCFNSAAPTKFGQQIAATKQGRQWDSTYQQSLVGYTALDRCRLFRNKITHEVSTKLRPVKVESNWRIAMIETFASTEGMIVRLFLEAVKKEIWGYVRFIDEHFSSKVPYLAILLKDNTL